jgi:hypothetical protein
MASQKDRRATQRFKPKPGNRLTYGATTGEIRDLSLEGVFVFDADPLPVGSEVAFTIRARGNRAALSATGRDGNSIYECFVSIEKTLDHTYRQPSTGSEPNCKSVTLVVLAFNFRHQLADFDPRSYSDGRRSAARRSLHP